MTKNKKKSWQLKRVSVIPFLNSSAKNNDVPVGSNHEDYKERCLQFYTTLMKSYGAVMTPIIIGNDPRVGDKPERVVKIFFDRKKSDKYFCLMVAKAVVRKSNAFVEYHWAKKGLCLHLTIKGFGEEN